MKKNFLLSFILSLTALSMSAAYDVPYFSTLIEDEAISSDWTVVDADNNEGVYSGQVSEKWSYPTASTYVNLFNTDYPAGVILLASTAETAKSANDRLVSPEINLEVGKTYRIRYSIRTMAMSTTVNQNPQGSIYLVNADDTEGATPVLTIDNFADQGHNSWINVTYDVTPDNTGSYRIVYSISYIGAMARRYCCFTNFSVAEYVFNPAAPSNITTTAGTSEDARELSLTLNWSNPTTDADGVALKEGQILEAIKIYRDGSEKPIATITDGSSMD